MIRIITDSTCEGPRELLAHPALHVVPLYVLFGQESLRDRVDISTAEFWSRLPKTYPLPTTSQATPGDFLQPIQQYLAAGDEIIVVTISSKLSGTYESAIIAQEGLADRPIDVVDSLTVSVGLGLMVQKALNMVDQGATRPEIVARLQAMRDGIRILFTLETLEYLQKGGRIGRAQAFMGTLLKFKPLLGIVGGEVQPIARVRSKRKALDAMLDHLAREVPQRGPRVRLAVVQACVEEEAEAVARQLSECFESPHHFIGTLGPVLGVHVGPGTIGAAAYYDEENIA